MSKVRVAIIIDDVLQTKQVFDLVKLSKESNFFEISHLVLQKYPVENMRRKSSYEFLSTITFKCLSKLEEYFIRMHPGYKGLRGYFHEYHIEDFRLPIIKVKPDILSDGKTIRYTNNDLSEIRDNEFEILISFVSPVIEGEILSASKKGIISFHYADTNSIAERLSPPGFSEVMNRKKSSSFSITMSSASIDSDIEIIKGKIATSYLYTLNKIKLYRKSNTFMIRAIEKILSNNFLESGELKQYSSKSEVKMPSLSIQFKYILKTMLLFLKKIKNRLLGRKPIWGVAYQFKSDWNDSPLKEYQIIKNPEDRFLADPFVVYRNNKHFCFMEDYSHSKQRGVISVYEINSDGYSEIGVALEEEFHLSYPFIFSHDNNLYMCPESHQANEIRIYKCHEFPLNWKLEAILMSGITAVDTSIFMIDSKWWLFTNLDSSNMGDYDSELHIFSSNNLFSNNWKPHSLNPVIFDSEKARNGGLIHHNDEIYRVFQKQGLDRYGEGFGVAKVTNLNQEEYHEEIEFQFTSDFVSNALGTHTFNFDNGLIATDFLTLNRINK